MSAPHHDETPGWFRAALRVPARERSMVVDGVRVRFREWGSADGQRVVLVHGGLANGHWWDHVAPALVSHEHTVVSVDLSGHGDSGHRTSYDLRTWAQEVGAVAEAGPDGATARRAIVVGHSMGGLVGWTAAQREPTAFELLVAVDSPIDFDALLPRRVREPRPLRTYPSRAAILSHFRTLPPQRILLDYLVEHIAGASIRHDAAGWTWKQDSLVAARAPERLPPPGVGACPVTLVRAELGIVEPATVKALRELLGESLRVVELPGAEHHAMLDRPLALIDVLRSALTTAPADPTQGTR